MLLQSQFTDEQFTRRAIGSVPNEDELRGHFFLHLIEDPYDVRDTFHHSEIRDMDKNLLSLRCESCADLFTRYPFVFSRVYEVRNYHDFFVDAVIGGGLLTQKSGDGRDTVALFDT